MRIRWKSLIKNGCFKTQLKSYFYRWHHQSLPIVLHITTVVSIDFNNPVAQWVQTKDDMDMSHESKIFNSELLILGKKAIEISSWVIILPSHHSIGRSGGARDMHTSSRSNFLFSCSFRDKLG